MKRLIAAGLIAAALVIPPAASVFADSTGNQGQPSQSCQVTTTTPGNASSAPGSPFSGGTADNHYAGNPGTASAANSNSTHAVSQYDVACFQQTQHNH